MKSLSWIAVALLLALTLTIMPGCGGSRLRSNMTLEERMDSALKLYENAVNSPDRSMLDGVGHGQKRFDRRTYIADWFMKQLQAD